MLKPYCEVCGVGSNLKESPDAHNIIKTLCPRCTERQGELREQLRTSPPQRCKECNAPMSPENNKVLGRGGYCHLCQMMYNAVTKQPGLIAAHSQWEREQEHLKEIRRNM